jgi:DNA invertase Pin-like site-specific DNA recombinase
MIGYARVSTVDQDLALQLDALKAVGCQRCFSDTASGSLKERPQLAAALRELRDGEDTLVVWRLDRLGRSLRHLIELIGELERRQLGFRSLTEGIDTTTSSGRLVFHIFGAEFERQLIRERTQAGLKAARARGRRGGRRTVITEHKFRVAREMLADGQHTHLLQAGLDVREVQCLASHRDLRTTQRYVDAPKRSDRPSSSPAATGLQRDPRRARQRRVTAPSLALDALVGRELAASGDRDVSSRRCGATDG